MSDLRKDNFVAVETEAALILGVIASMSKKLNTITLTLPSGETTDVAFDSDMINKVTKVEYNQLLSGVTLTDLFQARTVVEPVAEVKAPKKAKAKVVADSEEPTEKEPSKADQARQVYAEMSETSARKDVIKAFIEVVGLTKQGAATYYYNCTKARAAGQL